MDFSPLWPNLRASYAVYASLPARQCAKWTFSIYLPNPQIFLGFCASRAESKLGRSLFAGRAMREMLAKWTFSIIVSLPFPLRIFAIRGSICFPHGFPGNRWGTDAGHPCPSGHREGTCFVAGGWMQGLQSLIMRADEITTSKASVRRPCRRRALLFVVISEQWQRRKRRNRWRTRPGIRT